MKKIFFITILMANIAQARVSDFNNLITENIKAQNNLHNEVKLNMDVARESLREKLAEGKVTVVESNSYDYNSPSKKLFFKKESQQYRPSDKKQMDRVANEFKELEKEF